DRVSEIKDAFGNKQNKLEDIQELFRKLFNDMQNIHEKLAEYINTPSWNRPTFYNNDEDDNVDYTIAITSNFSITDSLSMGDEHLSTISKTESDELIKSSVENLVPNPSESDDLSDIEKEPNSKNSDAVIESFSPSSIPVEGNGSHMEEIDIFLTPDDSIPPGIEIDDYDSEGDILFLEEFLSNDSPSLPENESFHFDVPSSPRPPAKPPDDDGIYFDDEPVTGVLTVKVVGDILEHYIFMPRLLPIQPTIGSNEEKSPHLLSHRGFKAFQLSSESSMMIYGGDIPILDVSFLYFYPF
nr:hypothetical protein [Tanacetum cinerariifolium]